MDTRRPSGLRSTAAINGYPLHPLLVPFPIAFLIGNAIALILSAISLYLRLSGEALSVTGAELLLSVLVVVIFAITGWLGGELVFRHGVGMAGERSALAVEREPQISRE